VKSKSVARAFGGVLRAARIERGMSQEEVAEHAYLHRTYPSLLERGLREPTLSVLIQLARALHCAPTALVEATLAQLPPHDTALVAGIEAASLALAVAPPIRPHRAHRGPRLRTAA